MQARQDPKQNEPENEQPIIAKTEQLLLKFYVDGAKLKISHHSLDHRSGEERIGKPMVLDQHDLVEAPEAQRLFLEFLGVDTSCLTN